MAFVYEFLFLFLLFFHLILLVLGSGDGNIGYKGECPSSFSCGYLGNITFPFTTAERPDCGLLPIHNCDDHNPTKPKMIQLQDKGKFFGVVRLNQFPKACVFRDMDLYTLLQSKNCQAFTYDLTLPLTSILHFVSLHIDTSTTMFSCNRTLHASPSTYFRNNYTKCPDYDIYYDPLISADSMNAFSVSALASCTKFKIPIKDAVDAVDPFTFITADIFTQVNLTDECADCYYIKRGRCQLDRNQSFFCANGLKSITGKKMSIAATAVGVAVLIVLGLLAYYCIRTKISLPTFLLFKKENPTHRIIEEFLKAFGPLPATRYSYSDLKKITNSFKNKLGQGGYGSVYKGKLLDGSTVAVKVLSELKGNGEDFINEVASISRTSHVNVVRLLGFCLDGSKKALIYDFMSNGSLEKFIYEDKHPSKDDHQLDCKTLHDIVVGVARGLEYLHRGCNTRILHFDIKPHNILLDEDFCPKISDFGLAKICQRKESIVSMFGVRGTVGYIAPEVFSRNFGGVSHKSDVYSYGMMVLEMVGAKWNNNVVDVERSSEIYFPHWIYKRLEDNEEPELRIIKNEIDKEMVRKMVIVSLWCIQTNPSDRPSMSKVVEMMEGRLESLQIPPKPFLSSPPRSSSRISDYSSETSHMINETTSKHSSRFGQTFGHKVNSHSSVSETTSLK